MIEYAWVIQRDDGRFYVTTRNSRSKPKHIYSDKLVYANKNRLEDDALDIIKIYNLQNCKVVRIEMKVAEKQTERLTYKTEEPHFVPYGVMSIKDTAEANTKILEDVLNERKEK